MYTFEAHKFVQVPRTNIVVCHRCGLLPLRNPLTAWAIRMGCDHEQHPDWRRVRVELVKQHQEAQR